MLSLRCPSKLLLSGLLVLCLMAPVAFARDEAAMYHFALRLFENGEYQLTITQLEELISQYPSGEMLSDAVFLMGYAHDNLGNYKDAARCLLRYVSEFEGGSRYCEAMVLLATNQRRMGHYSKSEATLVRLLANSKCEKQREEGLGNLAELLFVQERYEEAIERYQTLFSRSKGAARNQQLSEHFAQSNLAVSKFDEARKAFKALHKRAKEPQDKVRYLSSLAEVDYLAGDYEQSEKIYSEVLEDFPDSGASTSATLGLIWSVYRQKSFERAASLLSEFRAQRQGDIEPAGDVIDAHELWALGDRDRAIEELAGMLDEGVGRRTRLRFLIMQQLSAWQEANGDYLSAATTCRELLKGDLGNESRYEIRFRLAKCLLLAKRLKIAENLLNELIEEDSFGARIQECYLLLARASRMRMNFAEARRRFNKIVTTFPKSAIASRASVELAEMMLETGEPMEAIGLLNSALGCFNIERDTKEFARFLLCKCFAEIRAFENCEASAERFLKDYRSSSYRLEVQALRAHSLSNLASAKGALRQFEAYDKGFQRRPPEDGVVLGALFAQRSTGKLKGCLSYLSEVRSKYDFSADFLRTLEFWECYLKRERGDERAAAEQFSKLARESGDRQLSALCFVEAAKSGVKADRLDDAIEALTESLSKEPGWPFDAVMQEMLHKTLIRKGDFERSVTCVADLQDHEPGIFLTVDRTYRLALGFFDEQKYRKVIRILRKQIEANPGSKLLGKSRLLLARALMAKNRLSGARDAIAIIINDESADPQIKQLALSLSGDVWYRRQNYRKALESYRDVNHPVLPAPSAEAQLLFRVAQAYRIVGELDSALQFYAMFLNGQRGLSGLCEETVVTGDSLRKMKNYELANEALLDVINDNTCETRWQVEAQFWFAHVLQEQGNYQAAIVEYMRLDMSYAGNEVSAPWIASASASVGLCYEAKGEFANAMRTYKKIMERFPESLWSKQAQKRIDRMTEAGAVKQEAGAE